MNRPVLPGFVLLLLLTAAGAARAQLVVEITQGQADAIPIAIVPFGEADPAAPVFDVAQVVSADLASSGRFAPMGRDDMVEKPTRGADVVFNDWRTLKTDYIVVGQLQTLDANRFQIVFELFNVLNHQRLLGFQITSNRAGLRLASHQVADMVYEKILGVKGAFASRIAYIAVSGRAPNRQYRLIVADADGANPRVVMQSGEPLMSPAWSPDGQSLAYVSFENRLPAVFVQHLKTGERRRVSAKAGVNQAPAWSPDGRRLALLRCPRAMAISTSTCWSFPAAGSRASRRTLPSTPNRNGRTMARRCTSPPTGPAGRRSTASRSCRAAGRSGSPSRVPTMRGRGSRPTSPSSPS
ncbi:MAG: hypothetical protein U1F35_10135 [Steroidobacteraceae bacterium]